MNLGAFFSSSDQPRSTALVNPPPRTENSNNIHKIIFLDVDGVLNSDITETERRHAIDTPNGPIDKRLLRRLSILIRRSNAHIVVSSTWRCDSVGLLALKKACWSADIPNSLFVGETPQFSFCAWDDLHCAKVRVQEIYWWLEHNLSHSVEQWVALDDLPLATACPESGHHMVRTDPAVGLQDEHVELALKILEGNSPSIVPKAVSIGMLASQDNDNAYIDATPELQDEEAICPDGHIFCTSRTKRV